MDGYDPMKRSEIPEVVRFSEPRMRVYCKTVYRGAPDKVWGINIYIALTPNSTVSIVPSGSLLKLDSMKLVFWLGVDFFDRIGGKMTKVRDEQARFLLALWGINPLELRYWREVFDKSGPY